MPNMGNVMGIIFSNTHDASIQELTKIRTLGSVPFGGRYRMIDFPLSNMVNSGITKVAVIAKSNYLSLLDHLKSGREWDLLRKNGGLCVLPPFSRTGMGMYRGSLEALAGAKGYIEETMAKYIVLTDCDVIANVDYRTAVEAHEKSDAEVTAVYFEDVCDSEKLKNKTVYEIGDDNRINSILINPITSGAEKKSNFAANMYIMNTKFLLDIINESSAKNLISFEIDILQHRVSKYIIKGYKYTGYYQQINTMLDYFNANMNMLETSNREQVFLSATPIYTKIRDEAPVKYGLESSVKNSLIADGCVIDGTVENCIIFRGVTIGKGAKVKNSIIMQDTIIGKKCEISYAITDKDVTVADYRSLQGSESYPVYINKGANV